MAKNILFQNKDNDLLLTLPLKKELIISTRLTYLYLYNLVIGLLCLIPGLYIYISNIGISLNLIVLSVILIIFSPIIPTLLASVFGYIISFLTNSSFITFSTTGCLLSKILILRFSLIIGLI